MHAHRPPVTLVAAVARNRVIGRGNDLPWHLPEDLAFFKRLTLGHPVVMGRRTFDSIVARLGKPLPGRTNIVVTREAKRAIPGATAVDSIHDAVDAARGAPEAFVIGGAEIFRLALPLAQRAWLTEIDADFAGDTFLPALDAREWREAERQTHPPAGARAFGFAFVRYERTAPATG